MGEVNIKNIGNCKYDEVCRLCSSIKFYLMSISSNKIITMIEECAPVNVTIGDNLPQSICQECYDLLEKIVSFRKICIESEIKFLNGNNKGTNECDKTLVCKSETYTDHQIESGNESDQNETGIENIEDVKIKQECPKEEVTTPNGSDCDNNDLPDMGFPDSDSEPLIKYKKSKKKPRQKRYGRDRLACFKCEICSTGREYTWKGIIYHMEHCHTIEPLKCSFCPREFYYEPQLKSHEIQQHVLLKCNHCHQGFSRRKQLKIHYSTNPGHKKPYGCSLCDEWFEVKSILRKHEREIHNKKYKIAKAECSVCHKIIDKKNLKTHQLIHGNRGRLSCPNCPKTFYHQISLDYHKRKVHEPYSPLEEVRNYLCNLCGFATKNKSYLERHLATHSNDRPYRCDQCPKAYKQQAALKSHFNNRHLNIRPHVCSQCGLGFFTNRTLEDHIRTHTGEKPFKCELCEGASFGSKAGLYLHMQGQHVSKPPVLNMFKYADST